MAANRTAKTEHRKNEMTWTVNAGKNELSITVKLKEDEAMRSTIKQGLQAAKGANKTKAAAILDELEQHPRMWVAVERVLERRYKRDTGKEAKADLGAFLTWISEKLPAILKILSLILMFI